MALDGGFADHQAAGDLALRHPLGNEREYFGFTSCQSGGELRCGAMAGLARGDGVQEVLLDGRVNGRLAAGDPFEGLADFRGTGIFGQVAAGTGPQRVDNGPVIGVGGEHEDVDSASCWRRRRVASVSVPPSSSARSFMPVRP